MADQQYLDEQGNPAKIYLDESGNPVRPQMTFARVNNQDVPIDNNEGVIGKTWNWLNKPLVDVKGKLGPALESYQKEHPVIGGIGNFGLETLGSLTSPLSLGLAGLTGGANVAERAGLSKVAQALNMPGKLASGGMVLHGGLKAIDRNDEYTTPERIGGGIEAALGGLGLYGLRNKGEQPVNEGTFKARLAEIPNQVVDELPNTPKVAPIDIGGKPRLKMQGPALPDSVQQLRNSLLDNQPREPLLSGESGKLTIFTRPKFKSPIPAVNDLFEAIRNAKPQVIEQEKLYSQERARRFGAFESVGDTGEVGARKAMGQLAGELPKLDMQTGKPMTQQSVDALYDMIRSSGRITSGEKATAITGLGKILSGGSVPQRSELNVLGRIFGPELKDEVIMMHGGLGAIQGTGMALTETSNLMKTMMASVDVSAPFRQGLPLAYRGEFWRSFDDMFKSLVSEKQFQGLMTSIEQRPNFLIGREAGLKLTDLDGLNSREEQFLSKIAEKIPGVRASERAYVGFLDKLRADIFDSLLKDAVNAGNKAEEVAPAIARFVNVSTGRGSLGRLEPIAGELNTLLFSPRLISSRLTMLNPMYYVNQPPQLRKEAIKALLSVAGAGLTIGGISKITSDALGKKGTIGTTPINTDFGKLRVGNTRLDPFGGFQQYIVAASRLLTGKEESSTSGKQYNLNAPKYGQPNRMDVVGNFAQSKLSPMAGLVATLLRGKDPTGKPVQISREVKDRFIPLFIQDVMDVMKDDPTLLPLTIPAAFGSGMQTYK